MVCSQNSKQLFLFSKSKLQLLKAVPCLHFSNCNCKIFQPAVEQFRSRSFRRTPNGCTFDRFVNVGRQSEARQSLGQCMHRMQCLVAATRTYDVDVYPCMGMALYTYAW